MKEDWQLSLTVRSNIREVKVMEDRRIAIFQAKGHPITKYYHLLTTIGHLYLGLDSTELIADKDKNQKITM